MVLHGWKAIAQHLGRGPRWCQRWIYTQRVPPLPVVFVQGRVEARTEELDAWAAQMFEHARLNPSRRAPTRRKPP